eukprot:CAMPEP_0183307088 /NCGR_PEP_ID=MMETSP0160_2-20130417/16120_1 /TAXON_ID=2839 ORGANISM="Odontella Sinensis, Strain Grunow 1884" /NCGR_SAMPLE_ID=MMETSP0160_2 /ASSEMBLY_ACC=CAM_ASM_000250 /LENGTH=250 /DNA_ID=CAMNT_0025470601 /DNA_START=93 /DNA_END=845 /DNA_ORIENTATION=+
MADIETGGPAHGSEPYPPAEESRARLKPIAETTPLEAAAGVSAAAAVGTSIAAMVLTLGASTVILAGVISSFVGAYVYYQQTQLTDINALKETTEAMKQEMETLKENNVRLKASVERLGNSVSGLEDAEQALDVLTSIQGQTVETFLQQLEESRQILKKVKMSNRNDVVQNIIEVMMRCDTDGDNTIDEDEVDLLLTKLKNINGVGIHEGKFRSVVKGSGGNVQALIDIIKDALAEDGGPGGIFDIPKDD